MALRIGKNNFEEKVLKSSLPVLVDFYSDSCIPCKMISPILGDLEDEHEGTLEVYKVNVNFDTELAKQYDVLSVPTLITFQNGEVKGRLTGAVTRQALEELLSSK